MIMTSNPSFAQAAPTTPPRRSSTASPHLARLEHMFLQLLVAQLKNQSPLNPMDPTQFVGQFAQFSELSEVTQIYQLLQQECPVIRRDRSCEQAAAPRRTAVRPEPQYQRPRSVAMLSSAVSAAQAAIPNFTSPSILFSISKSKESSKCRISPFHFPG